MLNVVRFAAAIAILMCQGCGQDENRTSVVGDYVPNAPTLHLVVDKVERGTKRGTDNINWFPAWTLQYHVQSDIPVPNDMFVLVRTSWDGKTENSLVYFSIGQIQSELLEVSELYITDEMVTQWNVKFGENKWIGWGRPLCLASQIYPKVLSEHERAVAIALVNGDPPPDPIPRPNFVKVKDFIETEDGIIEDWNVIDRTGKWFCYRSISGPPGEEGLIPQHKTIDVVISLPYPGERSNLLPIQVRYKDNTGSPQKKILLVEYPFKPYNIGKSNTLRLSDYAVKQ